MASPAKKLNIVKKFRVHDTDTGSADVQVALLTNRITELTGHLKTHKKDLSSRMGLIKLVSERRKLLNYVRRNDNARYEELIAKLEIRK